MEPNNGHTLPGPGSSCSRSQCGARSAKYGPLCPASVHYTSEINSALFYKCASHSVRKVCWCLCGTKLVGWDPSHASKCLRDKAETLIGPSHRGFGPGMGPPWGCLLHLGEKGAAL